MADRGVISGMDWAEIEKTLDEAAAKVADYAQEEARRAGLPFCYMDEEGRVIKEYPNGRRVEVVKDEYGKREIPLV